MPQESHQEAGAEGVRPPVLRERQRPEEHARHIVHEPLAFLTEAAALLASTLDSRRTLEHVVALAVPRLADWCIVDMLDGIEGMSGAFAVAHADPGKAALLRHWRSSHRLRPDAPSAAARVLRTGRTLWWPHVDEAKLLALAADEAHLETLRQVGLRSVLVYPLRIDGRVVGALSLVQAESGRRFEAVDVEQLRELALIACTALHNAMLHAAAQRETRLRDRVLGIVSHDLRTPLGTIRLAATLLKENPLIAADEPSARQVGIIERNVEHARRLIDDLLDLSSVQAGELAIDLSEHVIEHILAEAIEAERARAAAKGITLNAHLEASHSRILGDRHRLLQVFGNVIGNAIKYCGSGAKVTIRARTIDSEVVISCEDTGPGIAPDQLETVFDPHVRGDYSEPGTGLGLYITRAIVEAHKGRVWIESEAGAGTRVHVSLPRVGHTGRSDGQ